MAIFDEKAIPRMMKDCANSTLVFGAITLRVPSDKTDEELLRGNYAHLIGRAITITAHAGSLPGMVEGATFTLDGVTYKAHVVLLEADGGVMKILAAVD